MFFLSPESPQEGFVAERGGFESHFLVPEAVCRKS